MSIFLFNAHLYFKSYIFSEVLVTTYSNWQLTSYHAQKLKVHNSPVFF